jgi:hypothetical protein
LSTKWSRTSDEAEAIEQSLEAVSDQDVLEVLAALAGEVQEALTY